MRQVLRSRRLEGKLFDFSPGRQSQYEIYAKLTKEVLASKVRKEERTKELIIKLLAILSYWMLKVSTTLTKELLSPKVLIIIIIIIIIVFIQYISDADNAICEPKFTLLLLSFLPHSLLFLNFSFIFLIICRFMPQVTKSKSLCELDQFPLKK